MVASGDGQRVVAGRPLHAFEPHLLTSDIAMNEHLMRALIEVCYAMADFKYEHLTAPGVELSERWTMMTLVRAHLETLLHIDGQPLTTDFIGSDAPTLGQC